MLSRLGLLKGVVMKRSWTQSPIVIGGLVATVAVIGIISGALYGCHSDSRFFNRSQTTVTVAGTQSVPIHCHTSLAEAVAAGGYHQVNQYIDAEDFPSYHFACKESQPVLALANRTEVIPIEDPIELTWRSARRLLIDAVGIRGQSVTPRTTIGRLGVSRALIRLAQIDRLAPHVNNVHSLRNRVDKLDILTIYHTCT